MYLIICGLFNIDYLFYIIISTLDKMAYITIGKVLAQRCLECGISDMINTHEVLPNSKVSIILQYYLPSFI